jgi:hypothetical protein
MCRIAQEEFSGDLKVSTQQNPEFRNRAEEVVHSVLARSSGPAKRQCTLVRKFLEGSLDGAYGHLEDPGETFLSGERVGVLALEVFEDDQEIVGLAGQPEKCGLNVLDHIPSALK